MLRMLRLGPAALYWGLRPQPPASRRIPPETRRHVTSKTVVSGRQSRQGCDRATRPEFVSQNYLLLSAPENKILLVGYGRS